MSLRCGCSCRSGKSGHARFHHAQPARTAPKASAAPSNRRFAIGETGGAFRRKSDLAKAFRYGISRQDASCPVITDGRNAIDTDPALRQIGIGRMSWLFAGADTLVHAMTIIETARMNRPDESLS